MEMYIAFLCFHMEEHTLIVVLTAIKKRLHLEQFRLRLKAVKKEGMFLLLMLLDHASVSKLQKTTAPCYKSCEV